MIVLDHKPRVTRDRVSGLWLVTLKWNDRPPIEMKFWSWRSAVAVALAYVPKRPRS